MPTGIALDDAGNLYISIFSNHVKEYTAPISNQMTANQSFGRDVSAPVPTPVPPQWRPPECDTGAWVWADSLCHPAGLAIDAAGDLYVADKGNHRVLKFDAPLAPPPTPTPTATATPTPVPTPTSSANLKLSPAQLKFPKRVYGNSGDTSAPKKVTVSNPGGKNGVPVTIDDLHTEGDFQIASGTCAGELPPGKKCTLSLTFTPQAVGTREGKLILNSNSVSSPDEVALSGQGAAAKMAMAPTSLKFPKQAAWTTSTVKTATLKNNNRVGLTIASITSSDPQFVPSQNCVGVLAPKSQCAIGIWFKPTAPGKYSADITVTDNAAAHPTVKLTGVCK